MEVLEREFGGKAQRVPPIIRFKQHKRLPRAKTISHVAFAPDGELLAFCSDGRIVLWPVAEPFAKKVSDTLFRDAMASRKTKFPGLRYIHNTKLSALSFSSDGEYLVSGDGNGELCVWKTSDLKRLLELPTGGELITIPNIRPLLDLTAHQDSVTAIAFSPQTRIFCTSSTDESLMLWSLDKLLGGKTQPERQLVYISKRKLKGKTRRRPDEKEDIFALSMSRDGKYVAAGDMHGKVIVRDIMAGKKDAKVAEWHHENLVTSVAFRAYPDNLILAAKMAETWTFFHHI
jgi:WD40 repeat protein